MLENFDHQYKSQVKNAKTTDDLDRIAFNRVRSIARIAQEPQRSTLLGVMSVLKKSLIG